MGVSYIEPRYQAARELLLEVSRHRQLHKTIRLAVVTELAEGAPPWDLELQQVRGTIERHGRHAEVIRHLQNRMSMYIHCFQPKFSTTTACRLRRLQKFNQTYLRGTLKCLNVWICLGKFIRVFLTLARKVFSIHQKSRGRTRVDILGAAAS